MSHPNLDKLTGRDPNATFPVRTVAEVCSAHDNCHVISHWEQRDSDQPFTIAWHSHAHTSWHISCRLADSTPICEDNTTAAGGTVEWSPQCVDCHILSGCPDPVHPAPGKLSRKGDGTLAIHATHPRFTELSTHPGAEHHDGDTWEDCSRCAPRAAACDGCRAVLAGTG